MPKFTVTYEVEDGYVGGSRPQQFSIDLDDLDPDISDAEIEQWLDDSVHEDMLQKIDANVRNRSEFMRVAREHLEKIKAAEE